MRPEVIAFGQRMEKELVRATEEKGEDGWKTVPSARPLVSRIQLKADELLELVQHYEKVVSRRVPRADVGTTREGILSIAADIGNYAMMAADVCRAIPLAQPSPTDISNLRMMAALRTARAHIADALGTARDVEFEAFLQEVDDILTHKPVALKSAARAVLQLMDENERHTLLIELEDDFGPLDSPVFTDTER